MWKTGEVGRKQQSVFDRRRVIVPSTSRLGEAIALIKLQCRLVGRSDFQMRSRRAVLEPVLERLAEKQAPQVVAAGIGPDSEIEDFYFVEHLPSNKKADNLLVEFGNPSGRFRTGRDSISLGRPLRDFWRQGLNREHRLDIALFHRPDGCSGDQGVNSLSN
jgi:hypothetical protein